MESYNLYVIEGIDGSGKTTTILTLKKFIRKLKLQDYFLFLSEPTNFEYGKKIRELLKNNIQLDYKEWLVLFEKDRNDNFYKNILPNKYKIIIMDRYYLSTAAYQSRSIVESKIIFEYFYERFPKPKIIFFLDINISIAMSRIQKRTEKAKNNLETFEKEEYLTKIKDHYDFLLQRLNSYSINFIRIDANQKSYRIAKIILKNIFSDFKNKNISFL